MARFLSLLLWTVVFLLLVLAVDQLLLRVPAKAQTHVAVATFYRDLRGRLLDLASGKKPLSPPAPVAPAPPLKHPVVPQPPPASIESVIDQRQATNPTLPPSTKAPTSRPASADAAARYLFVDERGTLHFAATLAEVPEQYRDKATRLGE